MFLSTLAMSLLFQVGHDRAGPTPRDRGDFHASGRNICAVMIPILSGYVCVNIDVHTSKANVRGDALQTC